jgi:hypothetical protein
MGLRPTEIHENLFERRRAVDTVGSGAVDRVFPVFGGGFSTLLGWAAGPRNFMKNWHPGRGGSGEVGLAVKKSRS